MSDEELIARLDHWIEQQVLVLVDSDLLPIRDRIEALTAELDEANKRGDAWRFRADIAEVKLAKAVEGQKVNALEQILEERGAVFDAMVDAAEDAAGKDVSFNVVVGRALRAAIAEIKGDSRE